ncbi:MAG: T9SS type A sorting domain-containing protein [Chitinophagaceae bacterium]|nr:T9SS type A sorting domain-containing protein [Chitinophagaceae bacterium]
MKNILFILLTCISLSAKSQKLIGRSTYYHDSTGYVMGDSAAMFYKAANPSTALQDITSGNVSYKMDSMLSFSGAALTLNGISREMYDAGYTKVQESSGEGYTNGIPTIGFNHHHYFNGAQLDSSYFTFIDIPNNASHVSGKYYYHTNAQNQQDTTYTINLDNAGAFSSGYKSVNIYAGNNLSEQWSYNSTDSVNYNLQGKTMHYYNANNNSDSVVHFIWLAGTWYKQGKVVSNYNASQYLILKQWFSFDNNLQTYTNSSRDQWTRNNNSEIDTLFSQLWNQATQQFDTTVKIACVYQNGLLLRTYGYTINPNNMQWQPDPYHGVTNYYYDMMPNEVADLQNKQALMIFPNPSSGLLQLTHDVNGSKYYIMTADGRLAQSGIVHQGNQISTQMLTPGVYALLVEENKQLCRLLFVKE